MARIPRVGARFGRRRLDQLRALAEEHGQGHIFRWWDELNEAQRATLLTQVGRIDFTLLDRLIAQHTGELQSQRDLGDLEPAQPIPLPTTAEERTEQLSAAGMGEEVIRSGQVAALVVAGGQGTRLNYGFPKGTYPATPVTGTSLLELHARKLLAAGRRYGVAVPWYVMTSRATHATTWRFFRDQDWFGLGQGALCFIEQDSLPAVGLDGRLLLTAKGRLAFSPNGHGGVFRALCRSGALDDMSRRGVQFISYFQVDNPLAKPVDPVFLGHHILRGSDFSSKAVPKHNAEEKLGVFCRVGGRLRVVEYSDLPSALSHAVGPDGTLTFAAGNIAVHALGVSFARRVAEQAAALPYHRALKRVPCLDEHGVLQQPKEPNAVKFEMFVFDALEYASNPLVMTVERAEEFAPIKQQRGSDSPATARQAQTDLFGRWLEQAGVAVPRDAAGHVVGAIEISPLLALDAEELRHRLPPGTAFQGRLSLQETVPAAPPVATAAAEDALPVR